MALNGLHPIEGTGRVFSFFGGGWEEGLNTLVSLTLKKLTSIKYNFISGYYAQTHRTAESLYFIHTA